MNQIGAAWETWTPTFTPSAGTFTTVTLTAARYGRIQNVVFGMIDVTITAVGTGTGILEFTLPITPKTATAVASGTFRETAVLGYTGIISIDSTTKGTLRKYDNANYLASSIRLQGSFQYEAA